MYLLLGWSFADISVNVDNGMSTSHSPCDVMFFTCLIEFLLAFDTVDCGHFLLSHLTTTASLTVINLTRQLFHLQDIVSKVILRQIADSVARHDELFPALRAIHCVSRSFVYAPHLDTREYVFPHGSTRGTSRISEQIGHSKISSVFF